VESHSREAAAMAHVELGKVWADSLSMLKVRAGRRDNKALNHE
jgi:hypothetical protein